MPAVRDSFEGLLPPLVDRISDARRMGAVGWFKRNATEAMRLVVVQIARVEEVPMTTVRALHIREPPLILVAILAHQIVKKIVGRSAGITIGVALGMAREVLLFRRRQLHNDVVVDRALVVVAVAIHHGLVRLGRPISMGLARAAGS